MMKNNFPDNAVLELTYACNHKCKFCYCPWENTKKTEFFYEKKDELSIDEWKTALKILEVNGVDHVGFSGGEPLLKEGFKELLYFIRESTGLNKDRMINVISNGKLIDDEMISVFKETEVHLQLSLPGIKTYKWHTGYDESGNILRLLWLARKNGIATAANVIVTPRNLHEVYETIACAFLAGAEVIMLNRALVGGRGINYKDEITLNMDQIREMIETAQEALETAGITGSVGTEFPLCALPDGDMDKYPNLQIGALCAATQGFFAVDPSGYIRTCNHSTRRVGHILNDDILTDMEYWNLFAGREFAPPEMCVGCDLYDICDCGCREAAFICSGSLSAPDPCFSNYKGGN